jgi:hypothetical protein
MLLLEDSMEGTNQAKRRNQGRKIKDERRCREERPLDPDMDPDRDHQNISSVN